ncbi:amidohydrolase family protein [Halomonas sp. LBP4]|uniref:amidohydrolase family protein n=1 Tax=Halomonas sp. LBP4 TaxID=2044917 RepID=UPI000D752FA0|nr:amidohydrolase family protein [Halomonas sp. LBP4]PXY00097.1 cytosine deaminase [Halomonas sp. LBP4]
MAESLLLQNVRPLEGDRVDVLVIDGVVKQVGAGLEAPGSRVVDGCNGILLPGLVDAHTHLDKTHWGQAWHRHSAGPTIQERIEDERHVRKALGYSPEEQSTNQVRQAIAMGTTHIRTHVDIDTEIGLANLEGVLATRDRFQEAISLQVVAFPQSGLLVRPGTEALMAEAIRMGADLVGGIDPSSMDRDPVRHLDTIFAIADRAGVGIDIHLHEPGMLGAFALELIAERTTALGMQGRVTVSHAFCLGMVDEAYLERLTRLLIDNRIAIMTHGPGDIVFPPVRRLHEAGVTLCCGSDGIRDSWGPYGNADMLERAMLLAFRSGFRRDEDLELVLDIVTRGGAHVMGLADYGIAPGCRADFTIVAGETRVEAIMNRTSRIAVVKGGRLVATDGECLV